MGGATKGWERTKAYLGRLPRGVHSYPACTTKSSVALAFHEHLGPDLDLTGLPEEIVAFIRAPPLPSRWIPAVHACVVEMMVVDQLDDSEAFQALGGRLNEKYLGSKLYRAAVSLLSPGMLLRGAAARWNHFQKGSTLSTVSVGSSSAIVRLEFPDHLFPPIIAVEKSHSFRVALEHSGAEHVTIDVDTRSSHEAIYSAHWER